MERKEISKGAKSQKEKWIQSSIMFAKYSWHDVFWFLIIFFFKKVGGYQ